jgi:hypothetical protein
VRPPPPPKTPYYFLLHSPSSPPGNKCPPLYLSYSPVTSPASFLPFSTAHLSSSSGVIAPTLCHLVLPPQHPSSHLHIVGTITLLIRSSFTFAGQTPRSNPMKQQWSRKVLHVVQGAELIGPYLILRKQLLRWLMVVECHLLP